MTTALTKLIDGLTWNLRMEDAPRDGTYMYVLMGELPYLAYFNKHKRLVLCSHENCQKQSFISQNFCDHEPMAWMPLPNSRASDVVRVLVGALESARAMSGLEGNWSAVNDVNDALQKADRIATEIIYDNN